MAMKRCPKCGEKYSDTYQYCPFCEEEEALRDGEEIRRASRGGKRAASGGKIDLLTPTLVMLILIMAALLVYLLWGDKLAERFGGEAPVTPPTEEVTPPSAEEPSVPGEEDPGVTMPEDPDVPTEPEAPDAPSSGMTYEAAVKLPEGLALSTTDFTLKNLGESSTITVSGGSGTYTWISEDDGVASVDSKGKVTAVSGGTVNVLVTDGTKQATCIVRVTASGTQTGTPPSGGNNTSTGLKPGAATVINGGNGVRVRSGPSTSHEVLATVPNGASIKVVSSAGDGWYQITFSGVGGVDTTGYMKGEFLANQ